MQDLESIPAGYWCTITPTTCTYTLHWAFGLWEDDPLLQPPLSLTIRKVPMKHPNQNDQQKEHTQKLGTTLLNEDECQ